MCLMVLPLHGLAARLSGCDGLGELRLNGCKQPIAVARVPGSWFGVGCFANVLLCVGRGDLFEVGASCSIDCSGRSSE